MKKLVFFAFLFVIVGVNAQSKMIVGIIKDSISNDYVEYASITNMSKKNTTIANAKGFFTIEAEKGNLISIASVNHYIDTLILTEKNWNRDTLFIPLHSITKQLKDVTVTGIINRYQYDSTLRRKQFLENIGGNKIPAISAANSGAGIALDIDRFSKREKYKRKAYEFFEKLEQEHYINYRFSVQFVAKYTGLKDNELIKFMTVCRPSYTWLRQHNTEEDLKYYINDQIKLLRAK